MPKDRDNTQRFDTDSWKAPTSEPDAGKVWIAGAATDASLPVLPGGTAQFVTFSTSATGWQTVLSAQANTGYEIRLIQLGNTGATICEVRMGFSTSTYVVQGVGAGGVPFNQNMIGCYWRGGDNKAFMVDISTATEVSGTIWYKEI